MESTILSLFEENNISTGMALQNYCFNNPTPDEFIRLHGEDLASLYRKALGSLMASMVNRLGVVDRSELEHASRLNLLMVGTAVGDIAEDLAGLLKFADESPEEVTELARLIHMKLGLSEVYEACGLNDPSVSDEEYSRRYQAWINAQSA